MGGLSLEYRFIPFLDGKNKIEGETTNNSSFSPLSLPPSSSSSSASSSSITAMPLLDFGVLPLFSKGKATYILKNTSSLSTPFSLHFQKYGTKSNNSDELLFPPNTSHSSRNSSHGSSNNNSSIASSSNLTYKPKPLLAERHERKKGFQRGNANNNGNTNTRALADGEESIINGIAFTIGVQGMRIS